MVNWLSAISIGSFQKVSGLKIEQSCTTAPTSLSWVSREHIAEHYMAYPQCE